jgi:hypothetical protein
VVGVEVGRRWPFPASWGRPDPATIPERALVDEGEARAFLARWALGKIREQGYRPARGLLDGAAARRWSERRRPSP